MTKRMKAAVAAIATRMENISQLSLGDAGSRAWRDGWWGAWRWVARGGGGWGIVMVKLVVRRVFVCVWENVDDVVVVVLFRG